MIRWVGIVLFAIASAASGEIEAQISVGDAIAGGVSTVATLEDKGGYTGTLYDLKSLTLSADSTSVAEESTDQLDADAVLDDGTRLGSISATWVLEHGPIASISNEGLATTLPVLADTSAGVRAEWLGLDAHLTLTVLDSDPDNFGGYAGDGLPDAWQVGFFGPNNPDAAPALDPDGDGQDNAFEYLAVVDPTDVDSFFGVRLQPGSELVFSPVSAQRSYTLLASADLVPENFVPVEGVVLGGTESERILTDPSPLPTRRFYRIEISDE